MNNEGALVRDALQLTQRLQHCPIERLLPHSENIALLRSIADIVYQCISDTSMDTTTISRQLLESGLNPIEEANSTGSSQRSDLLEVTKVHRSRRVTASQAAESAAATAVRLAGIIEQHDYIKQASWLDHGADPRSAHLHAILHLQRATASDKSEASERLLLACCCRSLAKDFQLFEERQGWVSQYKSLLQSMRRDSKIAPHRHGKHHQNFFSQLHGHQSMDKEKVEAGLRLGTKIRVMETLGEELHLGAGIGVLLGYECHKLSRLPYRDMPALVKRLEDEDADVMRPIRVFCRAYNEWWTDTANTYHERYGQSAGKRKDATLSRRPVLMKYPVAKGFGVHRTKTPTADSPPLFDESVLRSFFPPAYSPLSETPFASDTPQSDGTGRTQDVLDFDGSWDLSTAAGDVHAYEITGDAGRHLVFDDEVQLPTLDALTDSLFGLSDSCSAPDIWTPLQVVV